MNAFEINNWLKFTSIVQNVVKEVAAGRKNYLMSLKFDLVSTNQSYICELI